MGSSEVTKTCLDTLNALKDEFQSTKNNLINHPEYVALKLDSALRQQNINSHLLYQIQGATIDRKWYLPEIMRDIGFAEEVAMEVRNFITPSISDKLLNTRLPKLSVTQQATMATGIMADYKEAMDRIKPYVESKAVTPEIASEYANAIVVKKLESSISGGLSSQFGHHAMVEWLEKHPEIPAHVIKDLGLEDLKNNQPTTSYEMS